MDARPADDGRCVMIRVVDDGPGVPAELRKHVFEPGVSSKEGGWGVGLTLTRRIVEETHGGSIALGKRRYGAEFVVTLPVVRSERTT